MTDLCPKHESRVVACITAAHLDPATADRLRTDTARFCQPGARWCPPHTPTDTQETRRD